jgi:hypothetical protein
MNLPLLLYVHLFFSQEGKSIQEDILASRCFPAWVPIYDYSFLKKTKVIEVQIQPRHHSTRFATTFEWWNGMARYPQQWNVNKFMFGMFS